MAGLDDAGMHRADWNLVQAVTVHGQEFIIRRITQRSGRARPERRTQLPLAMVEPWPPVSGALRDVAIEIADRAFESDRWRMMHPKRGKGACRDGKRNNARLGWRRPHRHVDSVGIAP
jgi:hypothetical protein